MLSSEVRQWCPMQRDPTTISPPAAAISLSQASKPSHNLAFRLQLSSQWEGFTPSLPTGFLQQVFQLYIFGYFQVDFKLQSEEGDTATFIENGEWALLGKHAPEATCVY